MDKNAEPKNWYNSLRMWIRPYQFNWIGRTKDGVNRWIGAAKGPSERACKNLMAYGIVMSLVGLIAAGAIMLRLEGSAPLGLLALIGAIHGVVFTMVGFWLRRMQRNLARLKTIEELADAFSSTPEIVRKLAEAHNIRAQININDSNLYDPEEFMASRSLLRGASSPHTSETLLRPAEPIATQSRAETLLRPAEPAPIALTPVQQLYYGADEESDETEQEVQILRR